jgi:ankyrin repeat protein
MKLINKKPSEKESKYDQSITEHPKEICKVAEATNYEASRVLTFHEATETGDIEALHTLIKAGANINSVDDNEHTSLYIASSKGYKDIVSMLLAIGANINCKSKDGYTPLDIASEKGHEAIVSMLLQYGANVKKATTNTYTQSLNQGTFCYF